MFLKKLLLSIFLSTAIAIVPVASYAQSSATFQTLGKYIRLRAPVAGVPKLEYNLGDTNINWQGYDLVQCFIGGTELHQQEDVVIDLSSGAGKLVFTVDPYNPDFGTQALLYLRKRDNSAAFPIVIQNINELQQLLLLQNLQH